MLKFKEPERFTLTGLDADLWKDIVGRCISAEMAVSAAARTADEVITEFRKRLAEDDLRSMGLLED